MAPMSVAMQIDGEGVGERRARRVHLSPAGLASPLLEKVHTVQIVHLRRRRQEMTGGICPNAGRRRNRSPARN
jgi:hypothetical protein